MNQILRTLFKSQPERPAPAPPRQQEKKSAPADTAPPIALQGDIAAISIENIFQFFDLAALTGKLEIRSPSNSGIFYFREGVLVHGLLQIHHRRIGQILLDSQVITPQQLKECLLLHEQSDSRQRFGQILIDKGYVQPEWLNTALLRQVKEAFFETLSWSEGFFKFYPDQFPAPDIVKLQARIDHLLLEGMVQIDNATLGGEEEE